MNPVNGAQLPRSDRTRRARDLCDRMEDGYAERPTLRADDAAASAGTPVNSVPPSPFLINRRLLPPGLSDLISIVYHLLPAVLGIIFVLWRAKRFLIKAFHLPAATSGLSHVLALMFGGTPA